MCTYINFVPLQINFIVILIKIWEKVNSHKFLKINLVLYIRNLKI